MRLVVRSELMDAAFELSQIERSDAPVLSQNDVHHGNVSVQVRIACDLHRHQFGVIAISDLERGAAGIVVELDPGDMSGLSAVASAATLAARPSSEDTYFIAASTASRCACMIWLRSASVGAKAHASETDLSALKQQSTKLITLFFAAPLIDLPSAERPLSRFASSSPLTGRCGSIASSSEIRGCKSRRGSAVVGSSAAPRL